MVKLVESLDDRRVDPKTVEILTKILEAAKSGKLRSIMFVELRGDSVGSGWCGRPDHRMLGEMHVLTTNLSLQILEARMRSGNHEETE